MPEQVCTGINVVELGSGSVAASLAGMMLADNGARVVKVEPPEGDGPAPTRRPAFSCGTAARKASCAICAIPQVASRCARSSRDTDVLLVGLDHRRMSEWGLGDDAMRDLNPALVYTSITGFGAVGPYAGLKAYEGVVAAKVGLYGRGIFGSREGPVFSSNLIASSGAAHLAVSGTLAALIVRETTGRGQRVDTSLVQGLIAADYFGVYHAQLAKRAAERRRDLAPLRASGMAASRYALTLCTRDGRWVEPVASTASPGPGVAPGRGSGVDARR